MQRRQVLLSTQRGKGREAREARDARRAAKLKMEIEKITATMGADEILQQLSIR